MPRPQILVLTAALGLLAAACGKTPDKAAPTSTAAPIAQTRSEEFHYDDPCSLLEPKEVEAVLGVPLAVPPFRSAGAAPVGTGDDCVYETADFHRIIFHVDFTNGPQAYRIGGFANKLLAGHPDAATKKAFKLDNGREIAGEWDEARVLAMNCCIFMTVRADQAIQIDFTGSDATLQQAAELVNTAYRRIDKPLEIDGVAGVEAAKAHATQRPAAVEACKLLSRAEVEAIVGKLSADPSGKDDSCSYEQPDPNNPQYKRQYQVSIRWRGGYNEFRSQPYVAGIAMHAVMANAPPELQPGDAPDKKLTEESGPWFHAGPGARGFMAVKKDVLVEVNSLGPDKPEAHKLAAAMMSKI